MMPGLKQDANPGVVSESCAFVDKTGCTEMKVESSSILTFCLLLLKGANKKVIMCAIIIYLFIDMTLGHKKQCPEKAHFYYRMKYCSTTQTQKF